MEKIEQAYPEQHSEPVQSQQPSSRKRSTKSKEVQPEPVQSQEQPVQEQPRKEKRQIQWNLQGLGSWVNRPWVLLAAPLIGGVIWLANHPEIITNNLNQPYALLAGPVTIASLLAVWVLFKGFKTISQWVQAGWEAFQRGRQENGSAQFFWIVIIVFLVVSVFASGSFFTSIEHDILPGLGYVTALFIDLVSVQGMRARLNAVRMRDKRGAWLYLFGVFVCSFASAWANVYSNLSNFNAATVPGGLPSWMYYAGPYFGLIFPALILFLSVTADYTVDQTSTKLDPDKYKAQEEIRINILRIQRDKLRERVEIEQEMDSLKGKTKKEKPLRQPKPQRPPISITFFGGKVKNEKIIEDLKKIYDEQIHGLVESNQNLQKMVEQFIGNNTAITDGLSAGLQRQNQQQSDDIVMLLHRIEETQKNLFTDVKGYTEEKFSSMITPLEEDLLALTKKAQSQGEAPVKDKKNMGRTSLQPTVIEENKETLLDLSEEEQVVINHYPLVLRWLSTGVTTVTIKDIIEATGHTHQMVHKRAKEGVFQGTVRKGSYRVSSVIKWLRTERLPKQKEGDNSVVTESNEASFDENNQVITSALVNENQPQSEPITDTFTLSPYDDESGPNTGENEIIYPSIDVSTEPMQEEVLTKNFEEVGIHSI